MSFSHILGQEHSVGLFRTALEKKKLAHAYLLAGPDGVGKKTLAKEVAKALNCQGERSQSPWPCDTCRECRLIERDQYPDVTLISPGGEALKIEMIRRIQQNVALKPYESRWRFILLEEVEQLTPDASHAFLKTLEEPPLGVYFFLTTAHRDRVFSTIRSRCQIVYLKKLTPQVIQQRIQDEVNEESNEIGAIVHLAGGSLGRAYYWLQPKLRQRRRQILDLLAGKGTSLLDEKSVSSEKDAEKEIIQDRLYLTQTWLRDLLIWKRTHDPACLIHLDYTEFVQRIADSASDDFLQEGIYKVNALSQAVEQHGNLRLIREMMERPWVPSI